MKKFLLFFLIVFYLLLPISFGYALSKEECAICNISAVIKLGAMTQVEIYNPLQKSFETTIELERPDGTVVDRVTVKWILLETESKPVIEINGGENE